MGACHAVEVPVSVGGVVTSSQAALLRRLGVDLGHGALWSQPLPAESFPSLASQEEPYRKWDELQEWLRTRIFGSDPAVMRRHQQDSCHVERLPASCRQLETFHINPWWICAPTGSAGVNCSGGPTVSPPAARPSNPWRMIPSSTCAWGRTPFCSPCGTSAAPKTSVWLSVNLSCRFIGSGRSFFRPISQAVEDLDALRRQVGKRLVIEVVEKGVAGPPETQFINELSQLHTIAVDDFGVGEAPLSHMLAFNYSKVKVDRSIVGHCDSDLYRQRFLRWLTGGCHGIDVEVCAEGIETESEAAFLRRLGVEQGQGWLWSKALPPEQFEALCQPRESVTQSLSRLLENSPS